MVDIAVGNVLAGSCCYSRDLARAHHCSHESAEFHCIYALADGFQYDHALAQYNHCGHARQAVDMTYVNLHVMLHAMPHVMLHVMLTRCSVCRL